MWGHEEAGRNFVKEEALVPEFWQGDPWGVRVCLLVPPWIHAKVGESFLGEAGGGEGQVMGRPEPSGGGVFQLT